MSRPSQPYVIDLQFRGHVEGLTYLDEASNPSCHFFGGVPYALPPLGPFRFQKPRTLPTCYRYGTKRNPARFTGGCGVCPQAGFGDALDESSWDEDCLQSNVWVPVGEPPSGGWPVLFWIHGGFLQWGTPNSLDLRAFLSASPIKCIIVAPAYRLNIFGFLASSNLPTSAYSANAGFWDQRAALQWTFENISYFGGNASNITLAGYSAGSHSVFHQLAYDLSVPDDKAIVKRAMMLSNGPGVQPKSLGEAQGQYTELLSTLSIPSILPPADQLARLRSLPAKDLITATSRMTLHQFRGVSDTSFISPTLLHSLSTGSFAAKMRSRNVQLMIGECAHEHFVYATWRPPSPSFSATSTRLVADYPASTVQALMRHYFPDRTLSKRFKTWQEAFGHIYADVQIHGTMRGMIKSLVDHGAGDLVHRYRIEWRAKCVDKMFPKEWGVTHSSDMALWFWGNGADLEGEEVGIARRFLEPVEKFIKGEDVEWGCGGDGKVVRVLKEGGEVVVERDGDERWDDGVRLWNKVVGSGDERAKL